MCNKTVISCADLSEFLRAGISDLVVGETETQQRSVHAQTLQRHTENVTVHFFGHNRECRT